MNDLQYAPSSRVGPHVEASANTGSVNTSTSRAPGGPTRSEEIQVPRSPQTLSLQVDGLNARIHDKNASFSSYVESSERDSDTSTDTRRPELQSANTFPTLLSSISSSSMNDSGPFIKLENSQSSIENAQTPTTYSSSQAQLSVNENKSGLKEGGHTSMGRNNGSLSPLRSSNNQTSRSGSGVSFAPGHKRTATGDVKSISSGSAVNQNQDSDKLGAARRRSKSTGAQAHGSRIAQLSVHIRTRLSYAAAKIEKSRQSREKDTQIAISGLESLSSATPNLNGVTSTSGSNPSSHPHHSSSTNTPRNFPSHNRSQSAISSGKLLPFPKLAPPVDIIPTNGDTRRRRPNPNMITKEFNRSPYVRHHRRHHSVQEPPRTNTLGSPPVLEPGPTHVPPSARMPLSAQHEVYRSRTHSQSTSMEQDAIETLLFMSSPENSGYRSSPRPLHPPASQLSLNESIQSHPNGVTSDQSQSSQSENSHNGRSFELRPSALGLETHAGDEIDRILDQMESDSEDEERYASHRPRGHMTAYKGYNRNPR